MPEPVMRDEFKAIISGWTLIDGTDHLDDILIQLEPLAPYNEAEERYIKLLIEAQIARHIEQGDFF